MARHADWYFDFISPFAYLQFKHFHQLPGDLTVTLHPVLFAGLLNQWEHKGPAEIPAKRVQTYQYSHWHAHKLGVPFRTPPAHPFNPLGILRLAIALDSTPEAVGTIFDYVWGEGGDVTTESGFANLAKRLDVSDTAALISAPKVKTRLRENTEQAISAGVYGVPTFSIDGRLFWGFDATPMMLEFLDDPELFTNEEMDRLANLPTAAVRPG